MDKAENQINDLEHKEAKHNKEEEKKEKEKNKESLKKINEGSVMSLYNNFKCSNICIIGLPEGEDKEQEIGNLFEKNSKRKLP